MSEINQIIERMVLALGVKNMTQMLEAIGVSNSLGSAWKRRKKVPDGALAKVSEISSVSIQWLKTGEEEAGQLDSDILAKTIERTEYILQQTDTTLNPAQKAAFISTLYDMAMDHGESSLDDASITRLIRLVG